MARRGLAQALPGDRRALLGAVLAVVVALAVAPGSAQAASPRVDFVWSTGITASAATVHAEVNPEGLPTTYRFEYIAAGPDYEAHGFEHAARQPAGTPAGLGSGTSDGEATQHLVPLNPATTYHYRIAATSTGTGGGTSFGPDLTFATQESSPSGVLPDSRGWEMVSPVDKNGGAIQGPEGNYGGDVLQAAAQGGALTYSSASAFGEAPPGAPPASQYVARRTESGWQTENITAPTLSGSYGAEPDGVPYRLFSEDLARGLMLDGRRCAEPEPEPCPRSYSLWEAGAFTELPETAGMHLVSASPDLHRLVFESEGNFYEWSGGGLVPIGPLPPSTGVLGTSADGQVVYYQTEAGLFLSREGASTEIAAGPQAAQPSDYPPGAGTARVSASGETLLFLSTESLTGYDNHDASTGQPDSEVFLYEAGSGGGGTLRCLSCNPTNERPIGPSTIPGTIANGTTRTYKPRALSADARRAFFDSADALVPTDSDGRPDVYEWEAQGEGSCAKPGGCLALLSGGRSGEASFIDASASGSDAFFLTEASLVGQDPGSVDLYDAREGGGFAEPSAPIECTGDACQPLPEPPEDPTVGTTIPGPPNPPLRIPRSACPKGTHRVIKHGKSRCVAKKHRRPKHRGKK